MLRIIIYISLFGFLLSSCGSKFSLQKKRYSKGFYFSSASKKSMPTKQIKSQDLISKSEVQIAPVQEIDKKPEYISTQNLIKSTEEKKPLALLASINHSVKKSVLHPTKIFSKATFKKLDYTQHKKTFHKTPADLLGCMENVWTGAYVIYILVAVVALLWALYETLPLNQFLAAIGILILIVLICYGVGSLVTGM